LRQLQQRFIDERRSFAVEDIHVDTQLLDQAKTAVLAACSCRAFVETQRELLG
jgi:hypothetical protein